MGRQAFYGCCPLRQETLSSLVPEGPAAGRHLSARSVGILLAAPAISLISGPALCSTMRLLYAILLICFVAAGPAAAIAISPGSVSAPSKITPAVQHVTMVTAKSTFTQPTTTLAPTALVNINSIPQGALVTIDGHETTMTTPTTVHLSPESHTIVLTLAGYQDYTTTISPAPNSVTTINAPLKPGLSSALHPGVASVSSIAPGLHLNRTIVKATVTTQVPVACYLGEHCLTTADAALYYQPNWGHKDQICGYSVTSDNQLDPKYCTFGTPSPITTSNCLSGEHCLTLDEAEATLADGWHLEMGGMGGVLCGWGGTEYEPLPKYCIEVSPKIITVQPGAIQSMAVINQETLVPVSQVTPGTTAPSVTKKSLGGKRQISMVDSLFGFISGFISRPVCPAGQTVCGGKCVDLLTDSQNCGSCDYTCFDPAVCISGTCDNPTFPQPPIGGLL
jgi:hypothetical protein